MDFNEFAETIKAKYPQYKDKDNRTLAEAIVKKHPEYASKVEFAPKLVADEQGNPPVDSSGRATGTLEQQMEYQRSGGNKFSTNPLGQRIVENFGEAVGGVGMGMLAPAVAKGGIALAAKGGSKLLSKIEQFVGLEKMGAKGINAAAGIKEGTVRAMTKAGQNPGKVGIDLGSELVKSGVVKGNPIATFDAAAAESKKAGEAVGSALKNIAKESAKYGGIEDPLAMDAKKALNVLDKAVKEKLGGTLSSTRHLAKPFKETYDDIVKMADKQGGKITLDDVMKVLHEVGPRTHKGSDEAQAVYSEIYGLLANTRDDMVTTLAHQAKNTSLKDALIEANKNYSRWIRVMPDLSKASSTDSVKAVDKTATLTSRLWNATFGTTTGSRWMNSIGRAMKGTPKVQIGPTQGFPIISIGNNRSVLDSLKHTLAAGNTRNK